MANGDVDVYGIVRALAPFKSTEPLVFIPRDVHWKIGLEKKHF